MYPLTHMTVACAAIRTSEKILRRLSPQREVRLATRTRLATNPHPINGLEAQSRKIDYRFLLFGAVLPDLLDKPLTWFLLPNAFNDDHVFGHTLLFPLLLLIPGLRLARGGDRRLLLVGFAALTHVLVDPVVLYPQALFWPLLGLEFPESRSIPGGYQIWGDVAIAVSVGMLTLSETFRTRLLRFMRTGAL
jgi:hypothetical protein